MDDIDILDQWAEKRAKAITAATSERLLSNGDMPSQRELGRHEAYMAVRSFIAGMKRQNTIKK